MLWKIVAVLLIVGLMATLVKVFYDVVSLVYDQVRSVVQRYQPLKESHRNILSNYCAYYNLLGRRDKVIFEKRIQRFMYSKRFIPRGVNKITAEMRVLISASAIQLTFGLGRIFLEHFDKILVYMDAYYSEITQKYHLGEVNPRAGIIIISWKSFVDGYADIGDSLNLGIHEMAHAIHFENQIKNAEYGFLDGDVLEKLSMLAHQEIKKINSEGGHFLRSYAGTNEYEFFAVSLEYFFERPAALESALPDLYHTLRTLLNQDPLKLYKLAA
ncbi:MAG: zinc-dependent peptidase [Bacteroidota bacterium]